MASGMVSNILQPFPILYCVFTPMEIFGNILGPPDQTSYSVDIMTHGTFDSQRASHHLFT